MPRLEQTQQNPYERCGTVVPNGHHEDPQQNTYENATESGQTNSKNAVFTLGDFWTEVPEEKLKLLSRLSFSQ